MNRKSTVLSVTLLALLLMTACPQPSGNDKYKQAARASRDFALALQAFQNGVMAAHHSDPPLIDSEEDIRLETLIKTLAKIDEHFNHGIAAAGQGQSAAADINAALAEAQTIDQENLDFVKNPKTKADLQVAFVAVKGVLSTIRVVLGQ